eukprot:TRINITY_DN46748_c0_g1_i1.p1 TRINITY_DN46748_c0_g1~~TRINITY_DN46748_c0_g1_i1.p1  ORF type:complete len:432 (-),score=87.68 TRINITY_DN46748_c0_g1_i1:244-1539(-)
MAIRTFAIFLASLFSGASAGACTPADGCPKLSDGDYCPVNDVTEHANINKDVKEISDKLKENPPNYAAAKTIYVDGMHSSKGAGIMRTLQSLATKDMSKGGTVTNVWYNGFVDLYGSYENAWNKHIMDCLGGTGVCSGKDDAFKKNIINKGLIGVVAGYVTYEMGSALQMAAEGNMADAGAVYAWDEAAAFHIGNRPCTSTGATASAICALYSPYEFHWKRDLDFPDSTNGHTAAPKIFNFGLLNLRGNGYNATNAAAAEREIYKLSAIAAIRSAIKYSKTASEDLNYLAEGWAYWRSASGYIAQVSASTKAVVQEIDALLDLSQSTVPNTTHCQLKAKVESLYPALGLDCSMVGTWKDDDGFCAACSSSIAATQLHGGSTAYVDMCKVTSVTSTSQQENSADAAAQSQNASLLITFAAAMIALAVVDMLG